MADIHGTPSITPQGGAVTPEQARQQKLEDEQAFLAGLAGPSPFQAHMNLPPGLDDDGAA
jgi:hypothetical protein